VNGFTGLNGGGTGDTANPALCRLVGIAQMAVGFFQRWLTHNIHYTGNSMNTAPIVSKIWSLCTTLRDDGVSYGDYLEQLTYLIFLKIADEYAKPPYNRDVGIPEGYDWQSLKSKRGAKLEGHYIELLRELATRKGMLGQIFTKAQNKIQDPAKLYRLIDMVDDTDWLMMGAT